jgi:hypothetical protein
MTAAEARRFAIELDLDVDRLPICLACLSIVSMQLDGGNQRKINGAVQSMTPDLWEEGLELPAWTALEAARDKGVPGAEEAIGDVLERGCHSTVARAIVRLLAEQLAERAAGDPLKLGFQPWPPPGGIPEVGPSPPPSPLAFPIAPLEMEVRVWRIPNIEN